MSNTPQGAESPLAIVDRRLCVRRPVPSLAYVDLGENNGGIILNIGEGGLAVTSVAPLYTDVLVRMRFQLPGSSDWLEASGEVSRISESRKQAGLRFVDLSEDTRNRIKNWVSSAGSPGQWQRETCNVSVEKKQPAGPPPTRTVKSATAEFAGPDAIAHEKAQGSMPVPETDRRSRGEEGFVASCVPREEQFAPDNLAQARDPLQHSDRRVHVRRPVPSLAYVDLGENNGGIILNIGEGGLAVTSVAPLYTDVLARMRFQLPGSSDWLEASGEVSRISESKKEAGLRFVDLSENTRNRIKGWISSDVSPAEFRREGVGVREKAWRRLEMPIMGIPQSIPPHPAYPDRVTRKHAQVLKSTPNAASTLISPTTWVAASTPAVLSQRLSGGTGHWPGVEVGDRSKRVLLQWKTWATLAVVVLLGAFLIGWFTAGMSRIVARPGKTRSETSETAKGVKTPPASFVASVPGPSMRNALPHGDEPERVSSSTAGDFASRPARDARTEVRSNELAPASSGANVVSSSGRVVHSQEHVLEPRPVSATANVISPPTKNVPPPGLGSVAAQTQRKRNNASEPKRESAGGHTNGWHGGTRKFAASEAGGKSGSRQDFSFSQHWPLSFDSSAGRAQVPDVATGRDLQIGQLLSRVDPVDPEDAKTQRSGRNRRKLHIVIGQMERLIASSQKRPGFANTSGCERHPKVALHGELCREVGRSRPRKT